MPIELVDGRPRSVLTSSEAYKEILESFKGMSREEQTAFLQLMESAKDGELDVIDSLIKVEYEQEPVDPRTFLLDDYYLGQVGGNMYPQLQDDFVELFTGNYYEAILSGSLGMDSIVVGADGSLRILGERVGHTGRVLTAQDDGTIIPSDADIAVMSGVKLVVRLTLANGMILDLTPDHDVRVWRHGAYYWVSAGDLDVDDLVIVVRKYSTEPSSLISKDEAMLMAYWAGDGSASEKRARFCDGNPETSKEVMELLYRLGFAGKRYRKGNSWEVHTLRTKTSGFWDWVVRHSLDLKTHYVIVPDAVCRASNDVISAFINRLWACEGTVYASKRSKSPPRFNIAMTSERFIRQVQLLLFRLDIRSRIYKVIHKDKRRGKESLCWHLTVGGVDNLSVFLRVIGDILGKEAACSRIQSYCENVKGNTNVDTLPITWGQLNDYMIDSGITRQVGNEWWKLGTSRGRRISRSMFSKWVDTYGDTALGRALVDMFGEDIGFEPVKSVESRMVHIQTGDITNVKMGARFIANGISVRNSLGWGKTYFATCALAYIIYQMSCLHNPQLAYGLSAGTGLVIALLSATRESARRVPLSELNVKLQLSPYFTEHCPFKTALTMYEIRFPSKKILVVAGSSASTVIGTNVFAAFMDEMVFMGGERKLDSAGRLVEMDRSEILCKAIIRRAKSRFQRSGRLPGLLLMVSSKESPVSFIERRIAEAHESRDTTVFIREYATWSVKPKDNFSGEVFQVAVGSDSIRSKIDPTPDDVSWYLDNNLRVVDVPTDYRVDFESDLEGSLREIAGIATEAISVFIHRREKIVEAVKDDLVNPLDVESWISGSALDIHWNRIATLTRRSVPGGHHEDVWVPKRHPEASRHIHIDPSLVGDASGVVIEHIAGWTEVKRRDRVTGEYTDLAPIMETDFILQVIPPSGESIELSDFRWIAYSFMEHGFNISFYSQDSYQCLAAETMIHTGRGTLPIKDIIEGDVIQSRIGPRHVKKKWGFGSCPTIKLVTQDGDIIEGTHGHRLEAQVGWSNIIDEKWGCTGEPVWEWKRLVDFSVGDIVHLVDNEVELDPAPVVLHGHKKDFGWRRGSGRRSSIDDWEFPCKMTMELAEWLGLVWGDGNITRDGVVLTVTEDEAEDAIGAFRRLFNYEPKYRSRSEKKFGVVYVQARWLVGWMECNELVKPFMPDAIMMSGKVIKAAFLRGLFAADGSVDRSQGTVSLSTKHHRLANQVRLVLRCDFGIESRLITVERGKPGDYVDDGFQYIVSVRGPRSEFLDRIGFSYKRKCKKLDRYRRRTGRRKLVSVAHIEESIANVYDLEIDEDPSYVANGFVSHNSVDSIQQMREKGVSGEVISVDKTEEPYNVMKTAFYEGRLRLIDHPLLIKELLQLQRVPASRSRGNIPRHKIDHPAKGAKDISDALAGVTYTLTKKGPDRPIPMVTSTGQYRGAEKEDHSWVTDGTTLVQQPPPGKVHQGQGMVRNPERRRGGLPNELPPLPFLKG